MLQLRFKINMIRLFYYLLFYCLSIIWYKLQLQLRPNTPTVQRWIWVLYGRIHNVRTPSCPPRHHVTPPPASGSVWPRLEARSSARWGRGGTYWSSTQPRLNSYKDHSSAHTCCCCCHTYCYHSFCSHLARQSHLHHHTSSHTALCERPHTHQNYRYTQSSWGAAEIEQASEMTVIIAISKVK